MWKTSTLWGAILACALALVPSAALAQKPATTGSINRDEPKVVISATSAPGDGTTSLVAAIRDELAKRGVGTADRPDATTYRVNVTAAVSPVRDGKQPLTIEWVVGDRRGKKIGTVTQKVEIQPGSLDGPWGITAVQAASAAAQGIVKLLPQPK
jgi:hypothetical protein